MSRFQASTSTYLPSGSTQTLVTGRGKIHGVILCGNNASNAAVLTLYDNTAAAAPVLMILQTVQASPLYIPFNPISPVIFNTGLTAVTNPYAVAFFVLEY